MSGTVKLGKLAARNQIGSVKPSTRVPDKLRKLLEKASSPWCKSGFSEKKLLSNPQG